MPLARADTSPLRLGVGLHQPDKEKERCHLPPYPRRRLGHRQTAGAVTVTAKAADPAQPAPDGITHGTGAPQRPRRPWALPALLLGCVLLVLASAVTLTAEDELGLGRKPWQNLRRTVAELSAPSFLRLWFGNPQREVRDGEGRLLRVEDERETEAKYLAGVGRALWTTLRIATLGTALAAPLACSRTRRHA